jgi:hypothetical protein
MPIFIEEAETYCSGSMLVSNYEEEQNIVRVELNGSRHCALIVTCFVYSRRELKWGSSINK